MKISIDEVCFSPIGQFDTVKKPNWDDIEKAIRLLETETGSVEIWINGQKSHVMIAGEKGEYYLVFVDPSFFLIDNSKPVSNELDRKTIGIFHGECLKHNTIDDIEVVVKMVKSYLLSLIHI